MRTIKKGQDDTSWPFLLPFSVIFLLLRMLPFTYNYKTDEIPDLMYHPDIRLN